MDSSSIFSRNIGSTATLTTNIRSPLLPIDFLSEIHVWYHFNLFHYITKILTTKRKLAFRRDRNWSPHCQALELYYYKILAELYFFNGRQRKHSCFDASLHQQRNQVTDFERIIDISETVETWEDVSFVSISKRGNIRVRG